MVCWFQESRCRFALLKGTYLFHRTSCSNFCWKSTVLNARKHLRPFNFNFTTSQQQLRLFIRHSKSFNRATVHCTCKGDFRNSYFLQRAALWEYLQPEFSVGVLEFLETGTVKRTYLNHQIFVKTIYLFQNTTCSRLFLKVVRPFLIKAAVFSEQHWLYWNKNSHLKFTFFCRQKFLRILSCLEQLLLPFNSSWLKILFLVSYSLKINTFSGQLPFRRNLFSRISNHYK